MLPSAPDRPSVLMELTPGQRNRVRQFLETELRRVCRSALLRGVEPGEVADLLATHRRALVESVGGLPDDAEHPADDLGEDGGIVEHR
ncbi:hypothetical protein Aau02nite_25550 [Amorphoplanes auranticolor]|uniref:Uncharacterized protein n=1 Tax=Actinoplanes auranticolor TaxID=47988 RepID=A0A919S8V4_9ACTN|nr:hypothetical protein Aau02nite_25550 [Actinoplanes auranticolor]